MVKQKIWSMGADAIVSADAEALQTKLSFQAEWKKKKPGVELDIRLSDFQWLRVQDSKSARVLVFQCPLLSNIDYATY